MDEKHAVERLIHQVREYAAGRASDVARGAETPRLAALLVQKYGRGMVDAATTVFESLHIPKRVADPLGVVVDEETAKLDPLWVQHDRERWAARPADVVALN